MRTSNPALNQNVFQNLGPIYDTRDIMTVQGSITKTFLLSIIVLISAAFSWTLTLKLSNPELIYPVIIGGAIAGFIIALIIIFKKTMAPYLSPIYALVEGLFLGALSSMFEFLYPGIVIQAIGLTLGVLFLMLFFYRTGIIKVTEKFKLGVVSATGAIFLIYLVSIILSLFGISMPYIHESGWIGIGFSLFVVVIASLNLVLDFDFIDIGSQSGAPKYMEWYAAFGLMVTLIWLYIEILRLLSKLRNR